MRSIVSVLALWAVSATTAFAATADTKLEPLIKGAFLPISLECPSTPNGQLVVRYRNVEKRDQLITVSFKKGVPTIFAAEAINKPGSSNKFYNSVTDPHRDELLAVIKKRVDPIYKRICQGDDKHKQDYKKFMQDNLQRIATGMVEQEFYDPSKD